MIMGTSIVSALLLMHRKVFIKEEVLLKQMQWLYSEIKARDGLISMTIKPTLSALRSALTFLKGLTEKKPVNSNDNTVKASKEFKDILMLAYYRNNLVHAFINESYIACALKAFGVSVSEE